MDAPWENDRRQRLIHLGGRESLGVPQAIQLLELRVDLLVHGTLVPFDRSAGIVEHRSPFIRVGGRLDRRAASERVAYRPKRQRRHVMGRRQARNSTARLN